MRPSVVDSDAGLLALGPSWEALWRSVPTATPFQSPAWQLSWWAAFGTGRPRVGVLRGAAGELLGLLPLYVLEEGGTRKLLPIGVGVTDYNDALIAPGLPAEAAAALLLRTVLANAPRDGVASCDLADLPPEAALRTAAAPAGWREESWIADPCPVLLLPEDPAALRGPVPSRMLRKLRMARHRADRVGPWTAAAAGQNEAMPLWEILVRLHQARWARRGEPGGVLGDPRVLRFHRAALPMLTASGALRLYAVRFGARVVAVCHALLAGPNRLLLYLSGFDEAQAYESPGTLLLGAIIEDAIAEGRRELHFLRGGEAYKYAWGGQDRMNVGRRLLPSCCP
jgi:CelD/BcsL family acetyltransferase involved in cellulose biosynthesis